MTMYQRKQIKEAIDREQAKIDGAIDPWLVKWAKSKWSMWIACGFGVALIAIGFVLGNIF